MKLIKKYRRTSLLATSYSKGLYALYVAKYVRVYNSSNEKIYELRIDYPSAGCFSEDDNCLFVFFNNHYVLKIDFINDSVEKVLELMEDSITMDVITMVSNKMYLQFSYFEGEKHKNKLIQWNCDEEKIMEQSLDSKLHVISRLNTEKTYFIVTTELPMKSKKFMTKSFYLAQNDLVELDVFSSNDDIFKYYKSLKYLVISGKKHVSIKKNMKIVYFDKTIDRTTPIDFVINEKSNYLMYEIDGEIKIISLNNFKVIDKYEVLGKINIINPDTLDIVDTYKGRIPINNMDFIRETNMVIFENNNDVEICRYISLSEDG
ncbi:hypothetical protein M2475_001835 [Breznakia sp. PF5-3]|uniref:hypothetical protein n=1 Tax=unclassified Breznakia TaxID=2623764 RepID=UPI002405BF1E|nr:MULTISPECIES: hypothetical protein [unclassified Breznakia]MDF9825380.1 hypothetical protein [Breznakia sp. PM6-1]MDF9836258.1 hypothetical protein [Breznakia sp. PF5-3]MDF9860503.1 hypothetical protein [Breznakia sp. PH5-24]